MCGRWETVARAASCASAVIVIGTAPHVCASSHTSAIAAGRAKALAVTTQGRPTNKSACAAAGPERSRPLKIIPLGGLGEFGMNSMAIRYGDDIIVWMQG